MAWSLCSLNPRRQQVGGRKALLTDERLNLLEEALESTPSNGGIWTSPKVARWIEQETGVKKVWNQREWDYLKKFKYSWQSSRPKHKKADRL